MRSIVHHFRSAKIEKINWLLSPRRSKCFGLKRGIDPPPNNPPLLLLQFTISIPKTTNPIFLQNIILEEFFYARFSIFTSILPLYKALSVIFRRFVLFKSSIFLFIFSSTTWASATPIVLGFFAPGP